jgi:hypothetical protein
MPRYLDRLGRVDPSTSKDFRMPAHRRRTHLAGQSLHPAGHHRWAITVRVDGSMRGRTWNVGIKVGRTMQVVPLEVR